MTWVQTHHHKALQFHQLRSQMWAFHLSPPVSSIKLSTAPLCILLLFRGYPRKSFPIDRSCQSTFGLSLERLFDLPLSAKIVLLPVCFHLVVFIWYFTSFLDLLSGAGAANVFLSVACFAFCLSRWLAWHCNQLSTYPLNFLSHSHLMTDSQT